MIRQGRVVQADQGSVKVCFERLEACGHCGMCSGGGQDQIVELKGSAKPGDLVDVEMPDAKVLKASVITYMIPLAGLILGLWLGTMFSPHNELVVLLFGLIGLGISFAGLKVLDHRLGRSVLWQPQITAVYPAEYDEEDTRCEQAKTN